MHRPARYGMKRVRLCIIQVKGVAASGLIGGGVSPNQIARCCRPVPCALGPESIVGSLHFTSGCFDVDQIGAMLTDVASSQL